MKVLVTWVCLAGEMVYYGCVDLVWVGKFDIVGSEVSGGFLRGLTFILTAHVTAEL